MVPILSSAMRLLTLTAASCVLSASLALADDAPQPASAVPQPAEAKPTPHKGEVKIKKSRKERDNLLETKAAREQRVTAFVKQHNPKLEKLLVHLKQHNTEQYDKAVRELGNTAIDLAETKSKDMRLYDLELRAWQAKTQVQLLLAEAMISEKKGLEAKLRDAIREELQVKADELAYKRDKSVANYERQIRRLEENREQLIEARLKKLLAKPSTEGQAKPKRAKKTE